MKPKYCPECGIDFSMCIIGAVVTPKEDGSSPDIEYDVNYGGSYWLCSDCGHQENVCKEDLEHES